jgi:hypothetical protein
MKPYLSNNTRTKAMAAIDDLSTEQLLAAVRQAPVPDYRRKELDKALAVDMTAHHKMFPMEQIEQKPQRELMDPRQTLAAMSYAKAPTGPRVGSNGPGPKNVETMPEQGDSLGPMRVERPKLEVNKPVYDKFRSGNAMDDSTDEGGGSNHAVT